MEIRIRRCSTSLGTEPGLQLLQEGKGSRGHHEIRGVHRRDGEPPGKAGAERVLGELDAQHPPRGEFSKRRPRFHHHGEGIRPGEDPGEAGRGVFSHAVAQEGRGTDPPWEIQSWAGRAG
jgi:hypothetical protein